MPAPMKSKVQQEVENAFIFKDFLSFISIQRWLYVLIAIIALNVVVQIFYYLGFISVVTMKTTLYFQYLGIFFFLNYIVMYIGIKIYRGFTKYLLPFIKYIQDVPFRLHQKLLED